MRNALDRSYRDRLLIVSKIRCVSEEDVNAFPEQEENEKIKIFKDFLESCD